MDRVANNLPIFGGIVTPVLAISYNTIFETVVLAAIGALTGLVVKLAFEAIVRKIKNSDNVRESSKTE